MIGREWSLSYTDLGVLLYKKGRGTYDATEKVKARPRDRHVHPPEIPSNSKSASKAGLKTPPRTLRDPQPAYLQHE
jgi:hypothetical protein